MKTDERGVCVRCEHPVSYHNAAGCGIKQCGCMIDREEATGGRPPTLDAPLPKLQEIQRRFNVNAAIAAGIQQYGRQCFDKGHDCRPEAAAPPPAPTWSDEELEEAFLAYHHEMRRGYTESADFKGLMKDPRYRDKLAAAAMRARLTRRG